MVESCCDDRAWNKKIGVSIKRLKSIFDEIQKNNPPKTFGGHLCTATLVAICFIRLIEILKIAYLKRFS